jgi:hypothetical protein
MYARKTYSRTQDRKTVGGKIDVSREELADFKRKYGADKTLRDLLNYDRTGKLPGVKTAEGSGRGVSAGRTAAERAAVSRAAGARPAARRRGSSRPHGAGEMVLRASRGMGCIRPELTKPQGFAKGGETKSTPNNASLWSKVKSEARSKFDVYPSAYANAWAAKEYKKRGGSWGRC